MDGDIGREDGVPEAVDRLGEAFGGHPAPLDPSPWPGVPIAPVAPHSPLPIDHSDPWPASPAPGPRPHGDEWRDELSFIISWDGRITLPADAQRRIEAGLRRAVLAELAEIGLDDDVAILTVRDAGVRGVRVKRVGS